MVTNSQNMWWSRGVTLVIWALAAASAAWWGLRITGLSQPVRTASVPLFAVADSGVDAQAVARVLGAVASVDAPASPAAASRFALLGVVASQSSQGAALISVDGKPGRAFRVGSKVEDGLLLQAVEPRRARLASVAAPGAALVLELPQKQTK